MKKTFLFFSTIILLTSCEMKTSDKSNKETKSQKVSNYQLVWSDEFEKEGFPDATKWGYDTEGNDAAWGNNEEQHYTVSKKENAWVENGILKLTAIKEDFEGKKFTSARLMSLVDWKYGRVEVNAKLPDARGTWSAIWMMPDGWTFNDGNWPDIGEIDIMEHVGHDLGIIHASAHSKDYQWQKNSQQTATVFIPDVNNKFHSYILEWTPEIMRAYVDDSLYFEYKNEGLGKDKWPYDKPFYLILNVAVGGAWGNVQGIDSDAFPQTMEIDFVRIYQKPE